MSPGRHDAGGGDPMVTRRQMVALTGSAAIPVLAGCSTDTEHDFEADPVTLPEDGRRELILAQTSLDEQTSERELNVGEIQGTVTITNWMATYSRGHGLAAIEGNRPLIEHLRLVQIVRQRTDNGQTWTPQTPNNRSTVIGRLPDFGLDDSVYDEGLWGQWGIPPDAVGALVPHRARGSDGAPWEIPVANLPFLASPGVNAAEFDLRAGINEVHGNTFAVPMESFFTFFVDAADSRLYDPNGHRLYDPNQGQILDANDPDRVYSEDWDGEGTVLLTLGARTAEEIIGGPVPGHRLEAGESIDELHDPLFLAAPGSEVLPGPPEEPDLDRILDDGRPAPVAGMGFGVFVLATPNAEIAGESVNPIARAEIGDLLTGETGHRVLREVGLTDAEAMEWRRSPEPVPLAPEWSPGTASLLGREVGIETYAGVVADSGGPSAIVLAATKVLDDDAVIPAAVYHRPVGTSARGELTGPNGYFPHWLGRGITELSARVLAGLTRTEVE